MEHRHLYGYNTNEIPGSRTVKTLEQRKNYVFKKLHEKIDDNVYYNYLIDEIRALEKSMNFIKWIHNNISDTNVEAVVEKYIMENKEKTIDQNIENDENSIEKEKHETCDNNSGTICTFNEKLNRDTRLDIELYKENGLKYISMKLRRRAPDRISWIKSKGFSLTFNKLEKIIRRANELENDKGKNNGT